jgi:hypothetical protein
VIVRRALAALTGAVCCAVGLGGAVVDASPAHATGAPGSLFAALSLSAEAGGERIIVTDKATHEGNGAAEGDVPFAQSVLSSSFGRSLASIVWPGTLAGNGGSTLLLIDPTGGKIPPSASKLNDPIRAQASTGSGAPKSTYSPIPGTVMHAEATQTATKASASIGSGQSATSGKVGTTHVGTSTVVTGAHAARSDAYSRLQNFALPGNLLTIGSLISEAHATTDGVHSTASGATTVTNVKVAGVPVTIDDKGVHAKGSGLSTKTQNAAINKALKAFQMQIYLVNPTKRKSGGNATSDAGGVIVDLGDGQLLIYLGGAQATSSGTKGTAFHLPTPSPLPLPSLPPTTGGGTGGSSGGSGGSGTGGVLVPGSTTGGSTGGTTGSFPTPVVPTGPIMSQPAGLTMPKGINPGWVVFFLLGTALIAAGMRRLPDKVLNVPATACPDGEQP